MEADPVHGATPTQMAVCIDISVEKLIIGAIPATKVDLNPSLRVCPAGFSARNQPALRVWGCPKTCPTLKSFFLETGFIQHFQKRPLPDSPLDSLRPSTQSLEFFSR
jgi:hypothetical protein